MTMTKKQINKKKAWDEFVKANNLENLRFYTNSQIGPKLSYRPVLYVCSASDNISYGNEITCAATLIKHINWVKQHLAVICADFVSSGNKVMWEEFKERILIEKLSGLR